MDFINDTLAFLASEVIFGLPAWVFIVVFGLIFIKIMTAIKPKPDKFKELDLKKAVKDDFKEYLNVFSEIIPLHYNYKLSVGYKTIGLIKRISSINWVFNRFDLKDKKIAKGKIVVITKKDLEKIKKEKPKLESKPLYIFEVYPKDNIFSKIKFILGFKARYFIVNKDVVKHEGSIYSIDTHAVFTNFLDVNVFSKETKGYVEDISFKIMREEELKELANFTRRMVWIEGQSAKYGLKGDVIQEIEKSKKNVPEGMA